MIRVFLTTIALVGCALLAQAQSFSSPIEYVQFFNAEFVKMQQLQIEYSSFLVHTDEKTAEAKRQDIMKSIRTAKSTFEGVTAYPDDEGLKKSALKTLAMMQVSAEKDYTAAAQKDAGCSDCFSVIEKEYELIDKDADEVDKAMDKMQKTLKRFAKSHEIELNYESNSSNSVIEKINRLNRYMRPIDLAVLQVQYADGKIIEHLNQKDVDGAKKANKDLRQAINEARKRMKGVEDIPEDAIYIRQAEKFIDFYDEAQKEIYPELLGAFNKDGSVINDKVPTYNKYINKLNNGANEVLNKYYQAKDSLMKRSIPKPQNAPANGKRI